MFVKGREGIYEEALLKVTQIAEAEVNPPPTGLCPEAGMLASSSQCLCRSGWLCLLPRKYHGYETPRPQLLHSRWSKHSSAYLACHMNIIRGAKPTLSQLSCWGE